MIKVGVVLVFFALGTAAQVAPSDEEYCIRWIPDYQEYPVEIPEYEIASDDKVLQCNRRIQREEIDCETKQGKNMCSWTCEERASKKLKKEYEDLNQELDLLYPQSMPVETDLAPVVAVPVASTPGGNYYSSGYSPSSVTAVPDVGETSGTTIYSPVYSSSSASETAPGPIYGSSSTASPNMAVATPIYNPYVPVSPVYPDYGIDQNGQSCEKVTEEKPYTVQIPVEARVSAVYVTPPDKLKGCKNKAKCNTQKALEDCTYTCEKQMQKQSRTIQRKFGGFLRSWINTGWQYQSSWNLKQDIDFLKRYIESLKLWPSTDVPQPVPVVTPVQSQQYNYGDSDASATVAKKKKKRGRL